jgi:hypothetical protein
VGLLFLAHVVTQTLRFGFGLDSLGGLTFAFSLGADGNIPTFYSSLAIMSCALLLGLIAISEQARNGNGVAYWFGLALLFAFLSVDEMLMVHERLIEPLRGQFGSSAAFHYAWVIPYGVGVVAFVGAYARFLMQLPKCTAVLFVAAGGVFVVGALGFEMVGGILDSSVGTGTVIYVLSQTVEETLEMVGIVIFLYAITDYIERTFGGLELRLCHGVSAVAERSEPGLTARLGTARDADPDADCCAPGYGQTTASLNQKI